MNTGYMPLLQILGFLDHCVCDLNLRANDPQPALAPPTVAAKVML